MDRRGLTTAKQLGRLVWHRRILSLAKRAEQMRSSAYDWQCHSLKQKQNKRHTIKIKVLIATTVLKTLIGMRCCVEVNVSTATVNEQTDTGNEGGVRWSEVLHCRGTVCRFANSSQWIHGSTTSSHCISTQTVYAVKNGCSDGRWTSNSEKN